MSEPAQDVPVPELVCVEGITFPPHPFYTTWPDQLKYLRSLAVRDDDIFLCAYPKTGTHWLWEVCTMLVKGKVGYEQRAKECAMLEFLTPDIINAESSPRIFNTHLQFSMLPSQQFRDKRTKLVHVYRNPKDVAVSLYFHLRQHEPFTTLERESAFDLESTVQMFIKGTVPFGQYTAYLKQMEKFVTDNPDLPIFTISYEESKRNPVEMVKRLAKFLNVDVSEQLCQDIAEACSFQKMVEASKAKRNLEGPCFAIDIQMYRKGEVGDWKNYLTVAQSEAIDQHFAQEMKDNSFFKMEYIL